MRVVKLAPQVMHEVNFAEDIFRGALYFEEVIDRLTTETTRENIQKEEEEDKILRIETVQSLTPKGQRKTGGSRT
jgi:hypothetical protein